jgi:hypothetical protein
MKKHTIAKPSKLDLKRQAIRLLRASQLEQADGGNDTCEAGTSSYTKTKSHI